MRFNKAIAAVLGISMAATPVLAQSSAPLAPMSRVGAATQDANSMNDDNGYLLPGLVIAAILAAAILWASSRDSDHNNPVSN
jgi:hypothetical protein